MNDMLRLSYPEEDDPREHVKTFGLRGLSDWHQHNQKVLKGDIIHETNENLTNTKNSIDHVRQIAQVDYNETTDQIQQRAQHVNYWKSELEQALGDISQEIIAIEETQQRLKSAMIALNTSESIANECFRLRANRMSSDLVYDEPDELIKFEIELVAEVRKIHAQLLMEIEDQIKEDVRAKDNLAKDWSGKEIVYKNENDSLKLKFESKSVKAVPGVTRLADGQSNIETWEAYSMKSLEMYQTARKNSENLRIKVDAVLINTARDLRSQDTKINESLAKRIAITEQVKTDLENQLKGTLTKICEVEQIIEQLSDEISKLHHHLRICQTRLNNKNARVDIENCREGSLLGLIEEVKNLNDSISLLENRMKVSGENRLKLLHERSTLENEIIIKKKTLHIDRERCLIVRSYYLSTLLFVAIK